MTAYIVTTGSNGRVYLIPYTCVAQCLSVPSEIDPTAMESDTAALEESNSQSLHDAGVKDLGWHAHPRTIHRPFVDGLSNEYIWMLIRRFNEVTIKFYVAQTAN